MAGGAGGRRTPPPLRPLRASLPYLQHYGGRRGVPGGEGIEGAPWRVTRRPNTCISSRRRHLPVGTVGVAGRLVSTFSLPVLFEGYVI